jgi:putative membrane protein
MRDFLLRLLINAAALAATAMFLPGIHIRDNELGTLLLVALIFGFVNAIFKPIILVLSCPLIILTFGLWGLVINGLMLIITDALAGNRFQVDGFWWAVLGGMVVSVISVILEETLGLNEEEDDEDQIVIIPPR